MGDRLRADVVIVGAGIAGTLAGYRLAKAGATVRELKLPRAYGETAALLWEIMYFEIGRNFAPEAASRRDALSDWMKGAIKRGLAITPARHAANLERCGKLAAEMRRLVRGFDCVLAPATPGEAPMGLGNTGAPTFSALWQIAGLPAVTVPAFKGPNGLPIAITHSPTRTRSLSPKASVGSAPPASTLISAMSVGRSRPTTLPSRVRPSASTTSTFSAEATTWAFVTT